MDMEQIKQIMELMDKNDVGEFELEEGEFRIAVKRQQGQMPMMMPPMGAPSMVMAAPMAAAVPAPTAAKSEAPAEVKGPVIKSPIVGTFYRSPSPDADPFVSVGKAVTKDTTVCIIEAMKVMNEIKAEMDGVIRKILVDNATPVQFGQPLFELEPS